MEGYIAEIRLFAANFAPRNWAYCQGQIIAISTNTALFSLLGTTYGGNGQTTFALPNFASRTAMGTGQGAGLSYVQQGQTGGWESVSLTINEIPAHNHGNSTGSVTPGGYNGQGDESNPGGGFPASAVGVDIYSSAHNTTMGVVTGAVNITLSGNSMPHNNIQPSLGMNYIICMYGIYPSRS